MTQQKFAFQPVFVIFPLIRVDGKIGFPGRNVRCFTHVGTEVAQAATSGHRA
jgi:hypothetical protein